MALRLSLLLAAFWLGLLVTSWVSATASFRTVDRVLGPGMRPELGQRLEAVPRGERRTVLRHLASEINRRLFRSWAVAQLALGVLLLAAAWPLGSLRWLAAGALVVTLVQALGLTGAIVGLGRGLDFVPRPLPPDLARRFGLLHAAYVSLDLAKAALLGLAAVLLLRRP
jgi:hypothetical protein